VKTQKNKKEKNDYYYYYVHNNAQFCMLLFRYILEYDDHVLSYMNDWVGLIMLGFVYFDLSTDVTVVSFL